MSSSPSVKAAAPGAAGLPSLHRAWRYPPSPHLELRWLRLYRSAAIGAAVCALASLTAVVLGVAPAAVGTDHWGWLPPWTAISVLTLASSLLVLPQAKKLGAGLIGASLGCSAAQLWRQLLSHPGDWWVRLDPGLALVLLLALALILPKRARWLAVTVSLLIFFTGCLSLLEKMLGSSWPVFGLHAPALAPAAGSCLALLSLAWAAAQPRLRPAAFCHEASSAGWLMRRAAPLVLVFPVLLAWIRHFHTHPLTTWAISVLLVTLAFVLFLTMLWKAAGALDALDDSRAQLSASTQEISDLYHQAPCGYHSLNAEGRIVKINDTELHWLGYRRDDMVDRVLFVDLLVSSSRAPFLAHFARLREGREVPNLELEIRRKDGSILPVALSASAVVSREGKFLSTRSTLFDITERRKAEQALRMSEARTRAILNSAADAIVTLGADGTIADFNPAAEAMFGLQPDAPGKVNWADLLAVGSALRLQSPARLAEASAATPSRQIEFLAQRADGSTFPAEFTLTRIPGQLPGLFTAFIRDLTARKRAEAELRDSEERLRLLLDSTGEGIYALDLVGNCILCNPAALRLLGYEHAGQLLGRPIHNLIHHTRPDGRPYPAHECRSYLAARQGIGIEVDDEVFFRQDGSAFPVEYRSYPVERNGQPVGLVVTFTDITTRRNLENQIRQSQKMEAIGRLAAGIAHDFNNLLTVINGYTDMLLESDLAAGAHEKLRSVRIAGDRAATLTHQLLAFSRQQVLETHLLDLNAVVRELEPLLRRTIGEDIELICDLTDDAPPIKADPSQLDQVLMNLVVNARDAMPHGGRLCIRTTEASLGIEAARSGLMPGNYMVLEVSDTGTGMPADVQAHIFEPFFTTKPQGKGTGLGLPTVFGIARQSGGTVVVESADGQGTTMRVYLPVYQSEVATAGRF